MPEYGQLKDRIRPLRWKITDMALFIFAKNRNLKKAFRYAKKHYEELWDQYNWVSLKEHYFNAGKDKYIAKQFQFHGFIPLKDYKDIPDNPKQDIAFITSNRTIEGITYIFPKKLYMGARPGKNPDTRSLWYHFEGGAPIPGYTRVWYPMELKSLKRAQDAQRNAI